MVLPIPSLTINQANKTQLRHHRSRKERCIHGIEPHHGTRPKALHVSAERQQIVHHVRKNHLYEGQGRTSEARTEACSV
jgi:hypothetical protein